MKLGKALGSISPLYGMATGKGAFGRGLTAVGNALGPVAGMMPMVASDLERRRLNKRRAGPDGGGPAMVKIEGMKKGGKVKKMAKGGSTASKRADGCAVKGKTKGRFV